MQHDFEYTHLTSESETCDESSCGGCSFDGTGSEGMPVAPLLQQWRAIPVSQFNLEKEVVATTHDAGSTESHMIFTSSAPTHLFQPWNTTNDSGSSPFGTAFVFGQRRLLAQGWPIDMVIGVDVIKMNGVFTDEHQIAQPATISQWVALVTSQFDCLGVPERLGLMLLCGRYLRWLVTKSVDDYQQVPDCMKPTQTQVIMPHEMWIDLIPWPNVRDVLTRQAHNAVQLRDNPVSFASLVTLDWPYPPADLIDHVLCTGAVSLSPLFERQALELDNWSLQPQALSKYPQLAGHVKIVG
ncbi:hypothetical protein LTR49_025772 [Elasticomyces elasticus]|nr:hypothetical protein LTR49_025772 [Elasticomyces elasticus]